MMLDTWGSVLSRSFQDIWVGVSSFVPNLIIAVIIFIIGWIVGAIVSKIVAQIFRALKIDNALRSAGFEDVVKRAGHNLDSGHFVGTLVKWFIIVGFLVAAFDVLGLQQVNVFLSDVVLFYLPRVIVAVLILLVSVVISDVMQRVVVASARAAHIESANLLGKVTRWAIWIFAILAVLFQLGIAGALIQTLFNGIVVAIALAVGLAFGLGGQAAAGEVVSKVRREISPRE